MVKTRDLILAAVLIVIGVMLTIGIRLIMKPGASVAVYIDGKKTETYHLEDDGVYQIQTEGGINSFHIENGVVWMESADCPDGLCIRMGKIEREGETIVCLPHKVVLQIEGGESAEYDIK